MQYQTISEIINQCVKNITKDIKSLQYVKEIDFIDIFPRSIKHKNILDEEALKIAKIIEKTDRGNFYVFTTPIPTKFGCLKIIKIRKFDETRLPWVAAPDFSMTDYDMFLNKYKFDKRFAYIERPTYKGLEFKTKDSLIYFLDVPTTTYYNIK